MNIGPLTRDICPEHGHSLGQCQERLAVPGLRVLPSPRCSDADRDEAIGALTEAHVLGRLSFDELQARLTAALSAQTMAQLQQITADVSSPALILPARWAPRPAWRITLTSMTGWACIAIMLISGLLALFASQSAGTPGAINLAGAAMVAFIFGGIGTFMFLCNHVVNRQSSPPKFNAAEFERKLGEALKEIQVRRG